MIKHMDKFYEELNPADEAFDSLVNPQVAAIAETLMTLGGNAHRDEVCKHIALERGGMLSLDTIKSDLIQAFEGHRQCAAAQRLQPLLHLPFGPESHRWSLTLDAYQFFRKATLPHLSIK